MRIEILDSAAKDLTDGFKFYERQSEGLGNYFLSSGDNEVGKGDHQHFGGKESTYVFTTPEQLVADFQNDIARWNHENRNS